MKVKIQQQQPIRWHHFPADMPLRELIQRQLDLLLPSVYGHCLVSIGALADDFTFANAAVVNVVRLNAEYHNQAWSHCHQLPLATDDIDAIFLPFQLELCDNPHSLLREAYRALRPGGKIILVCLNPMSHWGLRKLFSRFDSNPLWQVPFYRNGRLLDWLSVLDFKVTLNHRLYNPLLVNPWQRQPRYTDSTAHSWLGVINVVMAEKRTIPLTPAKPWRRLRSMHPAGIETVRRTLHDQPGIWGKGQTGDSQL